MNSKRKQKDILVIAQDAGGAEMLAAYIRKHFRNYNFHIYAGDPALRIFRRERLPSKKLTRMNINRVISAHREDFALLGTGRPVSLELAALKEIKRHHMMAAAYIDSWTNYRERFGYPRSGWQRNLPKEIWTGDSSALALAKQYFRTIRIRFVPNQYFANVVSTYRARTRRLRKTQGILYMSAASRHSGKLLDNFLAECSRRAISSAVRIRMHPENSRIQYERIISRHAKGIRAELSREKDIVDDLSSSES